MERQIKIAMLGQIDRNSETAFYDATIFEVLKILIIKRCLKLSFQ